MRSSTSSVFALGLLAFTVTACGIFGSDEAAGPEPTPVEGPSRGDGPKAPEVGGPADPSELTNAFGVFVATNGADNADGTLERPLARIQAGIDLGKKAGKRVYVCTGTYREALVLADSISVIGGLDCSGGQWRTGAPRVRIEAPTSPAVRAKDIVTATRLEALEIVAPAATAPGSSSIGLHAEHASALVIASSKIVAGDAAKGDDGVEGTQLTQTGTLDGAATVPEAECVDGVTCKRIVVAAITPWVRPSGGAGGTSVCGGAPGQDGTAGGSGGSGGLFQPFQSGPSYVWNYYANLTANAPALGQAMPGTAGSDGTNGANAAMLGTFSAEGYVPADGAAGNDGAPGKGGSGGHGRDLLQAASGVRYDATWRGNGGAGGGAGGCPASRAPRARAAARASRLCSSRAPSSSTRPSCWQPTAEPVASGHSGATRPRAATPVRTRSPIRPRRRSLEATAAPPASAATARPARRSPSSTPAPHLLS